MNCFVNTKGAVRDHKIQLSIYMRHWYLRDIKKRGCLIETDMQDSKTKHLENYKEKNKELKRQNRIFDKSRRKHILVITNHGCHSPVLEVTTDTGGQNFYVNDLSKTLVTLGYKVTILNRGGYRHPLNKKSHKGIIYYSRLWKKKGDHCRLIYLEDGEKRFIPKEKIKKTNLEKEKEHFFKLSNRIGLQLEKIWFISSHYWDGGILGSLIQDKIEEKYKIKIPHIWTPHSLGKLKKINYRNAPMRVKKQLNFPSRIRFEEQVIRSADCVVSTSKKIRKTLDKYRTKTKEHLWFPPGIEPKIFKKRNISQCGKGLKILKEIKGINSGKIKKMIKNKIVFVEVSRTTAAKQKDIVLKSFAKMKNNHNAILIQTLDNETDIYEKILKIYHKIKKKDNLFLIERYVKESEIAEILSLSDVYVTASIMEGWGMSVQEAAASNCCIISTRYVPFANEVLGKNAMIIKRQTIKEYSEKMDFLCENPGEIKKLAEQSYAITQSQYTWNGLVKNLIGTMKKKRMVE